MYIESETRRIGKDGQMASRVGITPSRVSVAVWIRSQPPPEEKLVIWIWLDCGNLSIGCWCRTEVLVKANQLVCFDLGTGSVERRSREDSYCYSTVTSYPLYFSSYFFTAFVTVSTATTAAYVSQRLALLAPPATVSIY